MAFDFDADFEAADMQQVLRAADLAMGPAIHGTTTATMPRVVLSRRHVNDRLHLLREAGTVRARYRSTGATAGDPALPGCADTGLLAVFAAA